MYRLVKRGVLAVLLLGTTLNAQDEDQLAVAVLNFQGRGISNMEAETLTERFASTVAQIGTMKLVERNQMENILKEQKLQQSGCTDAACAVEIGKLLNVQFLISGAIGRLGNSYTLDIKMFSVETGATSKAVSGEYQGGIEGLITEIEVKAWEIMGQEIPADLLARQSGLAAKKRLATVAIIDFAGRGVSNIEAQTLTDRFASTITTIEVMQLIEAAEMDAILEEMDFEGSECSDAACAVEIGQILNVEYMISGSIGKIGETYTIDIKLYNVGTSEMAKAAAQTYQGDIDGLIIEMELAAYEIMSQQPPYELLTQRGGNFASPEVPRERKGTLGKLLVPGLAHFKTDNKGWGFVYLTAEVATLSGLAWANSSYNTAVSDQDHYNEMYSTTTDNDSLMYHYRDLMFTANDDAQSFNTMRMAFAAASGGIWLFNLIHARVSSKKMEETTSYDNPRKSDPHGLSLSARPGTVEVRYAISLP